MLRKITVENFFSFSEPQTLDLTIAANATDPDGRFAQPSPLSPVRIPRVVTLFGPNASGKTNLLRAFTYVIHFMLGSFRWPKGSESTLFPFLTSQKQDDPSYFRLEFDLEMEPGQQRTIFEYELEVCAFGNRVLKENLRYRPGKRMKRLFNRTGDQIDSGADFDFPKSDPVRGKIRPDASVISTLIAFNHGFSTRIEELMFDFHSNVDLGGKKSMGEPRATELYLETPKCFDALKAEIARFDLGISDIVMEDGKNGNHPRFSHDGLDTSLIFDFESRGTQNFYVLYPMIWMALQNGGVAILDEFDNDIHPLLLPEIIRMFQDPENNPRDAQLVISCHNPSLLEHLTKEEIVFTEKDDEGQTSIFRLADIQGIRRDTNIYAKYLMGAFGGVPRVS